VNRVNQVWSTDITYIRMAQGFLYLVAVMDWFSRFVLSWSLSVTMELDFCVEACIAPGGEDARRFSTATKVRSSPARSSPRNWKPGRSPSAWMDGRGRCMDNIFIERLWRSLKYEEVYLKDYESVRKHASGSNDTSGFTTRSVCTRVWRTARRRPSTWREGNREQCEREGWEP